MKKNSASIFLGSRVHLWFCEIAADYYGYAKAIKEMTIIFLCSLDDPEAGGDRLIRRFRFPEGKVL